MDSNKEKRDRIRTPRYIAEREIGVPKTVTGPMLCRPYSVHRPMPCLVILVHGVNDTGEAYPIMEQGLINGLNERLGRNDLFVHEWQTEQHNGKTCTAFAGEGRSPIIPFYWGYKPVDYDQWSQDQQRYWQALAKEGKEAILPYDSYLEIDPAKRVKYGLPPEDNASNALDVDCFGNALYPNKAKGGGTFANATTTIPDMLGPGANGWPVELASFFSNNPMFNDGDFSHAINDNPHRIYQFFAAQRLADLILTIRKTKGSMYDTINIVAHSQGTIVTMLANMLVKQQDVAPADCVIFNNSPYALKPNAYEDAMPGQHQTAKARQQTFKNFCALMASNKYYYPDSDGLHPQAHTDILMKRITLHRLAKWHDNPLYRRNNFGKVYNYFSPDDGVVSLRNVQGIGWRGIPQALANTIPNLRQRVFCQHTKVGEAPSAQPFRQPVKQAGDYQYSALNVDYTYRDVLVNGEELPTPFVFTLDGENQPNAAHPEPQYQTHLNEMDKQIAYPARAASLPTEVEETIAIPPQMDITETAGQQLSAYHMAQLAQITGLDIVMAQRAGNPGMYSNELLIRRKKSAQELQKERYQDVLTTYSQHSAIVTNQEVAEKAMAYDLAIGQCGAFTVDEGKFWRSLMRQADWRDKYSKNKEAATYYQAGLLDERYTKPFMNKPDSILPTGEFGVVNEYSENSPSRYDEDTQRFMPVDIVHKKFPYDHNESTDRLQWPMPNALTPAQIAKRKGTK